MAKINLETITEAISDEQPCGPDLDMEFDMDFMNFIAEIEGMIPTRYFSFDPSALSFDTYYEQIGDFLERTRDIRVLVPLAKLRILQGDMPAFADTLDATHRLLKERWADVHPQPADFLELSMGQLSTLDDMPNVVLPIQHAPIVRSRRSGVITLRKWQLAQGDVNPREGEEMVDASTVRGALAEADADEIAGVLETLGRIRDSVAGIRLVCIEEAGFEQAPTLEKLPEAVEAMISLVETATGTGSADASGDPDSSGEVATGPGGSVVIQLPTGAVANREEAIEAMQAAAKYFALQEPSSPVPVLIREAQNATAKSFYELVNELVPDTAGSAFVALGEEPWFEVPFYTLDSRNPAPDYESDAEDAGSSWEHAGLEDEVASENDEPHDEVDTTESDEASEENATDKDEASEDGVGSEETENDAASEDGWGTGDAESGNDAQISNDEAEAETVENDSADDEWGVSANDDPGESEDASVVDDGVAGSTASFVANSRPEAVALLEKVLAYYRVVEPSSPVPLILERAIDLSSKNFIELLGKVLPDGSLKVKAREGDESY